MITLNVSMSDKEYEAFGLKGKAFTLDEFMDIVRRREAIQAFNACVEAAAGTELETMTMDEIDEEIKAYRAERKAALQREKSGN